MGGYQRARHLRISISTLTVLLIALPRASAGQTINPFAGSVPTGQATGTTLDLSLHDAFDRALKYNLGRSRAARIHAPRTPSVFAI